MRRVEYKTPNGNVIKVAFQYEVGDEIEVYIEKEDYEGKAEVMVLPFSIEEPEIVSKGVMDYDCTEFHKHIGR